VSVISSPAAATHGFYLCDAMKHILAHKFVRPSVWKRLTAKMLGAEAPQGP